MAGREWWINDVGQNQLKGVEDDPLNQPRLSGKTIFDFLRRIPDARASFNRLYPTLLPEEQERLMQVAAAAQFLQPDYRLEHDDFQASQNTVGVRTTGPHGGGRFGGNR
jgi:hypothetical protein